MENEKTTPEQTTVDNKPEKVEKSEEKVNCNKGQRKSLFSHFFDDSFFGFGDSMFERFFKNDEFFKAKSGETENPEKKEVKDEKKAEEEEEEIEGEGEDEVKEVPQETLEEEDKEEKEDDKPFVYGYKKITRINGNNEKKETVEKILNGKKYRIEKTFNPEGEEETKESFENLEKEELEAFQSEWEKIQPKTGIFEKALPDPRKIEKKKKKKIKKKKRRLNPFGIVRRRRHNPFSHFRRPLMTRNVWNPFDPFLEYHRPRFVSIAI